MKRYNMDGIYYRVKRDDEYQSVCFSDLTPKEVDEVIGDKYGATQWRRIASHLAEKLRDLGAFLESEGYVREGENNNVQVL